MLVGTTTEDALKATTLPLKPFYSQYDRRSAVYFPRMTEQQWQVEQTTARSRKSAHCRSRCPLHRHRYARRKAIRERSQLKEGTSETVLYRGRTGRWSRSKTPFEFRVRGSSNQPLTLQATYWGKQHGSRFKIFADDVQIGSEALNGDGPIAFIERSYPLPAKGNPVRRNPV